MKRHIKAAESPSIPHHINILSLLPLLFSSTSLFLSMHWISFRTEICLYIVISHYNRSLYAAKFYKKPIILDEAELQDRTYIFFFIISHSPLFFHNPNKMWRIIENVYPLLNSHLYSKKYFFFYINLEFHIQLQKIHSYVRCVLPNGQKTSEFNG